MTQARDVGSHLDGAALGIHDTWSSQHDGANPTGVRVVVAGETVGESGNLVQYPGAAAAVGQFVGLCQNSARDISQGDCQSSGSKIDTEYVTTLRAQFIQHGSPADIATRSTGLVHQALLLKRVYNLRHRLLGQTGHLRKIGPGNGAAMEQGFENAPSG